MLFYKHNKDTDEFVEYVEGLPVSDYPALLNDVKMLQSETADLLNTYYNNRSRFEAFDAKAIYHEHLEPMLSAYKAAQISRWLLTRTTRRLTTVSIWRS